jgi:hypothetical protein
MAVFCVPSNQSCVRRSLKIVLPSKRILVCLFEEVLSHVRFI